MWLLRNIHEGLITSLYQILTCNDNNITNTWQPHSYFNTARYKSGSIYLRSLIVVAVPLEARLVGNLIHRRNCFHFLIIVPSLILEVNKGGFYFLVKISFCRMIHSWVKVQSNTDCSDCWLLNWEIRILKLGSDFPIVALWYVLDWLWSAIM